VTRPTLQDLRRVHLTLEVEPGFPCQVGSRISPMDVLRVHRVQEQGNHVNLDLANPK
jgi:uncharacterized protein (DUF433 family)